MSLPSAQSHANTKMSSHFDLNLILYISLASLILISLIKNKKKSTKLPPGPPRLPLIGNLHQLKNPLHKTLQNLSKTYGDLMFLQLGSVPTLVISSSELTKEIVKNHDVAFSGRPTLRAPSKICYDNSDLVFTSYGEYWKEIKKIANLELFNAKRVQSFQAIRVEEVQLLLNSISLSKGTPFDIGKCVLELTNNVVCRAVFGKKFDTKSNGNTGVVNLLQETQDIVGSICLSDFFPWLWWVNKINGYDKKLEKTFKQLDGLFTEVISEHLDPKRIKPENEDLVDILLRLQQDTSKPATSNGRLKGVLTDMFIAGSDTSAAVIEWTMVELIRNPSIMSKAKDEVRKIFKDKGKVEEKDLSELVYLKIVVKEILRLHLNVPILIPRETIENCNIMGYEIPAKTRVFINAAAIALDPRSWEDPYAFKPERFLDNSVDFRGQHFELIPFGVGRRICPAINFAMVVIELVLASLLFHFDWELPHGVAIESMDMDEAIGLSVHKKTPLFVVASPAPTS